MNYVKSGSNSMSPALWRCFLRMKGWWSGCGWTRIFRLQDCMVWVLTILCVFCAPCQDQGYLSTLLIDPTQVESKKSSQIQWPVPSINAEPVDIFLGEE